MSLFLIAIAGILALVVVGFIAGFLFFRNNQEKIKQNEDSGKKLLDALKGR
jgi:ABC-type bacteriocin/lantibiotic exporter with double-glycine peptidase domain